MLNDWRELNKHHWWQAALAAVGQVGMDLLGKSKDRQQRAEAHDWAVEDEGHRRMWEERMFDKQTQLQNTAHQREVADLRAAGLNPILSAGGGSGAGSPSGGSSGTPGPADKLDNEFRQVVSAIELEKLTYETALLKAQENATNSSAEAAKAQARKTNKEADILGPRSWIYDKVEQGMKSGADAAKKLNKSYEGLKNLNEIKLKGKP